MVALIQEFPTAREGLVAELALLQGAAVHGGKSMMIWRAATPALTLPERYSRVSAFADAATQSDAAGWPVITRRTGGGITPQGPGVLNLALSFRVPPKEAKSVPASYAAICDPLIETFASFEIKSSTGAVRGSFCDGDYNLEIDGQKVVGTAQRWRGNAVLCHALVLVDVDLANAVAAAQRLSDGLGVGDTYDVAVHTQLSEFLNATVDREVAFAEAAKACLEARGYDEAPPQ